MKDYGVNLYFLQHKVGNEWVNSNLDVFFVSIPEYEKKHDTWQKYGYQAWEDLGDALAVLHKISAKYPERKFRMAEISLLKKYIRSYGNHDVTK